MDSVGLIKYYNALVALMVEGRLRPNYGERRRGGFRSFRQANLTLGDQILRWADQRDYEVCPYLVGAFGSHSWCYQPKFERLMERRYEIAYRDRETWKWWEILQREDQFAEKPEGPHPGHEIIKARLFAKGLGGALCFHLELTGRYDQRSRWCPTCEFKDRCR